VVIGQRKGLYSFSLTMQSLMIFCYNIYGYNYSMEAQMSQLVDKARIFAFKAHAEQKRKYSGVPYISHPAEVVRLLEKIPGVTDEILAAAWLHDVVEDCNVSLETIESEFGSAVASYVAGLSDVSKPEDGNRKARKLKDLQHTAIQCVEVKSIKLADLISNSLSILLEDHPDAKAFAKLYIKEKIALMEVLKEGDAGLYALARNLVEDYLATH
jgi:(p)ppGpp synthase/HD superfamily hydrolase